MDPLTKEQGNTLAKAIGASKYVEYVGITLSHVCRVR